MENTVIKQVIETKNWFPGANLLISTFPGNLILA